MVSKNDLKKVPDIKVVLDKSLKPLKWTYEIETGNLPGIINLIFAIFLLVVIAWIFIGFKEEVYKFYSFLSLVFFFCFCFLTVAYTEYEIGRVREYRKLEEKYPNGERGKNHPVEENNWGEYPMQLLAVAVAAVFLSIAQQITDKIGCSLPIQIFFIILAGLVGYLLVISLSKYSKVFQRQRGRHN